MAVNTVSLDVLAKLFEVTPRWVQKLASEGIIPRAEGGKYPLAASVQGYIKHLKMKATSADLTEDSYGNQRARLTKARADMAEMERRQLAAELIPADDVEAAWGLVTLALRGRLLAIPTKAVPRLLGATNAVQISEVLREEIGEALDELAHVRVEVSEPVRTPDARADGDFGAEGFEGAAEALD